MESTDNGRNYTGSGQGNLNTVLGSLGTAGALGLFGPGGLNLGGGNREPPVSQRELDTRLSCERQLTEKDSEIGQLRAEKYADAAVLAAERRLADKIEKVEAAMNTANATQAVINAQQTGVIGLLQNQVATLNAMTGLYIKQPVMAASEAALTVGPFAAKPAAATTTNG